MKTRRMSKIPAGAVMGIFLISSMGLCLDIGQVLASPTDIVINEIAAYETESHEWIEIYNTGSGPVDITGWVFHEDGSNHSLSLYQGSDMVIESGEYAIIADVAENFVEDYPGFTGTVIDSSWSSLNESGELIELRASSDPADTVESFTYISAPDFSLERADPILDDYSAANWQEHVSGNTAGAQNSNYNSGGGNDNSVEGTVVLTITPNIVSVQNIGPSSADIVFQVNGNGTALINYGLDDTYPNSTAAEAILENTDKTISLSGLSCGTEYHYSVYAENSGATETDQTADAVFTTMPCGIVVNDLTMAKTAAKANNDYVEGWEWLFDITIWDMDETLLKMKFDEWSGAGILDAGGNMQFSVNGVDWFDITDNAAYPALGADLTGIDNSTTDAGRQIQIIVQMKVPVGTSVGHYNSSYGILTEQP